MIFARKVWHLLVAIKDGLALIVLLLFFVALYGILAGRPGAGRVRSGALLVALDGTVVEEPAAIDPLAALTGGGRPAKELRARDVARAIRAAASDDRIKALVLDLSQFRGGGMVNLQELGAALDAVRASGKPVLSYGMGYTNAGMLLASHASEIWVDPLGGAFITGPGGTMPYFKGLVDKLGVNVHVFRVGTYKDFVEPYERDGMSDPSREARTALYQSLWGNWLADVSKARPKAQLAMVTKDPVGWLKASGGDAAKAALAAGLVDRIGDKVAFGNRVAELVGKDTGSDRPGAYQHTSLRAMIAAHGEPDRGKPVAVITVAGEIIDGKSAPGTAGGKRIAALIDDATADDAPALVLRVDSPGGSVTASEQIRAALERYKAKHHPVAVSMVNLAASGGYWVSTAGNRIFAEPTTVTGSIGIFAIIPSFEKLLANYGVKSDGVRMTPLGGQPDVIGGLTPEAESMLQMSIESGYARFIGLVGKARGKTPEQVDKIAQGRAWDGGTAHQLGLVDQFGGLDDAAAYAAGQAGLEKWHLEFYGHEPDRYGSLIDRMGGEDASAPGGDFAALTAEGEAASFVRALASVGRIAGGSHGAQAYCLDCPEAAAPPAPLAAGVPKGVLGALLARFGALLGLD